MDSADNPPKEIKKSKRDGDHFLSEESFFKAKQRAKEAAKVAKEKLRELERHQKKSLEHWNKVHVFNIMVNMLFDGVITIEELNDYCDRTLKEDYQRENVKTAINSALKKKREANNKKNAEQLDGVNNLA